MSQFDIDFPKVLVASPTANVKKYCFPDWLENAMNFKYPNYKIMLFDNSLDDGEFVDYMNSYFRENYGQNNDKFLAVKSDIKDKSTWLIERMCVSHNDCSNYAINNGYDYLLHLESDIFPPENIIEELICHKKQVCGALYHIDEGVGRRLMVQHRLYRAPNDIITPNISARAEVDFCDGTIKTAHHIGLGCILINKQTLKKVPFRFLHWSLTKGVGMHPDVYFAEDCHKQGIPIFVNTSIMCNHQNKNWNLYVYKKSEH